MKKLIATLIALFFVIEPPSQDDKPLGIYRTPDKLDMEELQKPITEENKAVKWLRNFRERVSKMSYGDFLENVWKTLAGLVVVSVIAGVFYVVVCFFLDNGNVKYCYIERWTYIKEVSSGATKPEMKEGMPFNVEKAENKIPGKDQAVVVVYELSGHRNYWREDRHIGRFESLETALEGAHKINCSVEGK